MDEYEDDQGPEPGQAPPPSRMRTGALQAAPFAGLTPDLILNAVDSTGLRTSGQVLALNSYENRVFQVGLEAGGLAGVGQDADRLQGAGSSDPAALAPVVVKFYRPLRWSDEAILEEHRFLAELVEREVPAVAPLAFGGRTLHPFEGFRFTVFPRRGGRAPELSNPSVRERIGRFLGRLHAVGGTGPFHHRPRLDVDTFGVEPSAFLLEHGWLPADLEPVYRGVVAEAIEGVRHCFERAGEVRTLRLHGDCHEGNLLWTEVGPHPGPHFVDFDDSRTGPAMQDLWMLLSGSREEMQVQLNDLLRGYEDFVEFNPRELELMEALRTLRLIHYSAWIARRWQDPAFPAAFPWFDSPRYWEARILELREQTAAMQEPALVA
jgi:Ser/Thr protein kinase RdoA (MazF antagonist)